MSKDEKNIGHVPCPCCDEPAPVRLAKGGKAYVTCASPVCGFQGFARSLDADAKLRAKMKPIQQATPKPEPKPEPKPQPKKGTLRELLSIDLDAI